jgi:signal transduction histidine kinase
MTFKSKTIAGFGMALVVLICVCVLSYRSMVQNAKDRAWVTHTHVVVESLDTVLTDLLDAETGQRGYAITGDESYLVPYRNSLEHVTQDVRTVREQTADNPTQQSSMDRLEPIVDQRLAVMREAIDARLEGGLEGGAKVIKQGAGRRYMDQLRVIIAEMKQEENHKLASRTQELDASTRKTKAMIVAGNALAVIFLFLAGFAVRQEMMRRQDAENAVRRANEDLERKVTERTVELEKRAKDLARSNSELEQFAYVASHDLQEPLRMVASFTQLLGKRYNDKLDDDAREFINFAVDGAKRMQTLISDLLSFSRVGTQGKRQEPIECDEVLDRVLYNLQPAIKESGAVITRGQLPRVIGNPQQLGQLFQNLIGNAIKFHGAETPQVSVTAERQGLEWRIAIHDNGIGISAEHMDRIFVIFQRLHTRTEYPGTGIGLAICKRIVERNGGRIWVESPPAEGSTFNFTIAAAETQKTGVGKHDELRIAAAAR